MCSPCTALLPATKEVAMADTIRLSLHETGPAKIVMSIEINNQATIQNLISSYCAKKGIGYNSKIIITDGKKNVLSQFRTLQSLGISNGQVLYIGYQKKSSFVDQKWIFLLTIAIIAIFILAIIVMASLYATSGGVVPFHHGIVMDGGSSKTNVLLYKWAGDKHRGTGCVRQADSCNVKGGIAKAKNVSYVLPCLNKVKKSIEKSLLPSTPLYFASTAGMRLLNMSDPVKAENVLDSLTIMLNDTGMSSKAIEIISGNDEGQYGWISANFLKHTLDKEQKLNPWEPTTVGALDMGGASAQISFALEPKNETDDGVEKTQLYGQIHHVFSSSNLCFGRDEAERRHRAFLVKDPGSIATVTDPCTPTGYVYNVTGGQLFDQPCTHCDQFRKWLLNHPALKDKNITFVGSSDFAACSLAMGRLVDFSTCRNMNFKECFRKINKPLHHQKFLAFATYYYTASALNLVQSTLDEYVNVTKNYCAKTANEMDIKKNKYATDYCFNACYIYEILINGYNFTNSTWRNIEFLGKIEDKEIGWSLGYMIKATNIIPAKKPSEKFTSAGIFAVCMIIFIFVVMAACLVAYNFGRKNSHEKDHLFQNP